MGIYIGNKIVSPYSAQGGSSSKIGLTIDNFIGDVSSEGVLQSPSIRASVELGEVKTIGENVLEKMWSEKSEYSTPTKFNAPNLETIQDYGMNEAFLKNEFGPTEVSFPKLKTVGNYGMFRVFYNNNLLTKLLFPSLETIGHYGLEEILYSSSSIRSPITTIDFSNLKTVGEYGLTSAFYYAEQLENADFPNVETVNKSGFNGSFAYSGIKTLLFPKLKTVLNTSAFSSVARGCKSLETINFDSFENDYNTDNTMGTFNYAFNDCPKLKEVSFPSLQKAQSRDCFKYAFGGCDELTTVNFPKLSILSPSCFAYSFANCSKLTDVNICSDALKNNETVSATKWSFQKTFSGCSALENVDFLKCFSGAFQESFEYAFENCTNIKTVRFDNLEQTSDKECFYCAFYGCSALEQALFPKFTTILQPNISSVNNNGFYRAFYNCRNLKTVDFSSLKNISSYSFKEAFYGCSSLESMSFPSLETVSKYGLQQAFSGCSSLKSISFNSLSTIENNNAFTNMFNGCTALTEIHFPASAQSIVEATTGYSSKWGASNATIYYDL